MISDSIAAGLLALGGVVLGGLLAPATQFGLEWLRERRASDRGKRLVAAELLQLQAMLYAASKNKNWPPFEDLNAFLPTSAWQEFKSSMVGKVDDELMNELVRAYAVLEVDRSRFAHTNRMPPPVPLPEKEAQGLRLLAIQLGKLRKRLGGTGGWPEDLSEDELLPPGR